MTQPRGMSGYVQAQVVVTAAESLYSGGGVAGFLDNQPAYQYTFSVKLRESDFQRGRSDTSGEAYRSSVTNGVSRRINLTAYYRGRNYPPDFELFEYVLLAFNFGHLSRRCVLHVESFKQTNDVDRALEYTIVGETDGIIL